MSGIEIRGEVNGRPVFVAGGQHSQSITVSLVGTRDATSFWLQVSGNEANGTASPGFKQWHESSLHHGDVLRLCVTRPGDSCHGASEVRPPGKAGGLDQPGLLVKTKTGAHTGSFEDQETLQLVVVWIARSGRCRLELTNVTAKEDGTTTGRNILTESLVIGDIVEIEVVGSR